VDDAGRCDQFVRRIALEIEPTGLNAHGKVDGPDVNAGEGSDKICIIQIDIDSTQLRELCELPVDNRGHAPGVRCQDSTLRFVTSPVKANTRICVSTLTMGFPRDSRGLDVTFTGCDLEKRR